MLDASVAFHYEPVRYSVDITHVSFRGSSPDLALNSLSGGVAVRNDTLYLDRIAVRTAESSVTVDGAIEHYLSTPVYQAESRVGEAVDAGARGRVARRSRDGR